MLYRYIAYPELYSEPPGAQLGMRYEIGPIRLAGGQLDTIGSVTGVISAGDIWAGVNFQGVRKMRSAGVISAGVISAGVIFFGRCY